MKLLSLSAVAAAALAIAPFVVTQVNAEDADELASDTVVCLKNTGADEDAVVVLYESYWNRAAGVRQVRVAPGKTSCVRYRAAKEIKPDFFYESQVDDVRLRAFRGVCNRVKGNFAAYYELGTSEDGARTCDRDADRSAESIRALVRDAKAINS